MKRILVNHPGDGEWIMERVGGFFTPKADVSIVNHYGSKLLGGFVLAGYTQASMVVHMAGTDPRWCSRDLLLAVFNYAFVQLGLRKLFAPVASTNYIALAQDLRAGFVLEAVLTKAYLDADMLILSMDRDACRWLKLTPKGSIPGQVHQEAA